MQLVRRDQLERLARLEHKARRAIRVQMERLGLPAQLAIPDQQGRRDLRA